MTVGDIVVIGVLALIVALIIRGMIRDKKKGKCSGCHGCSSDKICSGNCSGCTGCPHIK